MKKYILGLVSGIILIPVIESFLDVIYNWIEVLKIKPAKVVSEWNKSMTKNTQSQDTYCVGFQAPEVCEDDFEEDI